ncbi:MULTISPECIES: hypothetical protein [unclassified Novosphingobium]|uniref:hypothetical protein n=1 Tax=unclassified Novosphingobium TaxID=2644732 RepID=UPI001881E1CA|nr:MULTISPECIES: hypothetical protein [unclassified Novosphingobium]MCW1384563.1 hypothetical protein [Novosphingobium sp. KCTC 2891]QOV96592.1 hypothetical protein IM701_21345 [Novosphingobium sp. ES2-1]
MTPTPEQIAAFADGQLEGEQAAQVEDAVAQSPALQAQVAAHRALRARLSAHFAPVLEEEVSAAHLRLLHPKDDTVVDLASVRAIRKRRWTWVAAPALAASTALVVLLRPAALPEGYAQPQLAGMLDRQLVAEQDAGASQRVLLSFQSRDGRFCRAYSSPGASGIACHDDRGWKIESVGAASHEANEYRQAGSVATIMQQAQDMAIGPALDPKDEQVARKSGWRAPR